jgi:hypothetical protein
MDPRKREGNITMPNDGIQIDADASNGEGIYLFCFARTHGIPALKIAGIDDRFPVWQWGFKGVTVVVSKISVEDFTGPEAESRLKDLSWVGPRACRHQEVVEHVMRYSPVLPARFGTIFTSLKSLGKILEIYHATISRFLDRVADKDEFSVKGLMDRAKTKKRVLDLIFAREAGRLSSLSPGIRYFQEQRIRSNTDKEIHDWLKEIRKKIADDLNRYAIDFCELKVFSRGVTGIDMDIVLNWAFLVSRKTTEDFRARVGQANSDHANQGLTFQLSGPWPPYSFCPSLEMGEKE